MTCIIGFADIIRGKVWIGGDSAAVGNQTIELTAHPKVFRNGACLIGYTTSFRMGALLEHAFTPPVRKDGIGSDMAYIVCQLHGVDQHSRRGQGGEVDES